MTTLKNRIALLEQQVSTSNTACTCATGKLVILNDGDNESAAAMCQRHRTVPRRLIIDERSSESRARA
jgi:hypothetical protein